MNGQPRQLTELERAFVARLQTIEPGRDALWRGVMWVIARNLDVELAGLSAANVSDGEAHRLRGRMAMLIDLERELSTWLKRAKSQTSDEELESPPRSN